MKRHKGVIAALEQARREVRCTVGRTDAMRRALKRRRMAGELVSPFGNLYAPSEYWRRLNDCQRSLHVARGLAVLHPHWVFAGLTAADAYGFDHSWSLHDGAVYVADRSGDGVVDRGRLRERFDGGGPLRSGYPYPNRVSGYEVRRLYTPSSAVFLVNGIKVTGWERTLIDCALCIPFRYALPIFDAAARMGADMRLVREACKGLHGDREPIESLMRYADARSENGGESLVRASVILDGFAVPELQVEFRDPANPARRYRVDFLWRLYDGRMIVLEYDGMAKYEDVSMTHGRTAKQVLREQQERDRVLSAAGVTTILHCTYEDVVSNRLSAMLQEAGVPRIR